MILEVRCCCQPQKLLGWLPVPDDVRDGDTVCFTKNECHAFAEQALFQPSHFVRITLPVATFREMRGGVDEEDVQVTQHLALKSEETPIDVLRKIPGFKEATR